MVFQGAQNPFRTGPPNITPGCPIHQKDKKRPNWEASKTKIRVLAVHVQTFVNTATLIQLALKRRVHSRPSYIFPKGCSQETLFCDKRLKDKKPLFRGILGSDILGDIQGSCFVARLKSRLPRLGDVAEPRSKRVVWVHEAAPERRSLRQIKQSW